MISKTTLFILLLCLPFQLFAQTEDKGIIEGRIFNVSNNEPVPFASIVIWGTNIGSVSDLDGRFLFTGITPGFVELRVSSIGFKPYLSEQVQVTNAKKAYIDIPMEETSVVLDEVIVKASPFRKVEESPVSLNRIGIGEIEKNPGGNRDISKVIQSFPGVAPTVSYRNDLIVRGGGPNENRFYLDGVEIPNLNHFATQGASGGPVGIINIDFIREVIYYSGAFPSNKGNSLSSVLDFRQVDGNMDRLKFKGTIGASDLAFSVNGPVGAHTTFLASARRSYLQFLFSALELPFLPAYNDFQFKVKSRLDDKNELTIIGLGAIDQFTLNLEANQTEEQRYILSYLPVNEQWTYTVGAVYKHYRDRGYDTWVISRNHLNNRAFKYQDNIEEDTLKNFDYLSNEVENKIRYEHVSRWKNGFKINYGSNFEFAYYNNSTYNKAFVNGESFIINYDSELTLLKWGLFGQITKELLKERLILSFGLRTDANHYSSEMNNLLNQLSPRFSASYLIAPKLYLNFNTGRYYQLPPYTTLGFRNNEGFLVNKENRLKYIKSDHLVTGFELLPDQNSKISLEGFYKWYNHYPVSVNDKVSISSKGADFGTFGDEEVKSIARGKAFGTELLYRNKNLLGFNLILSYTLVRSKTQRFDAVLNPLDLFIPTAWDNRHILNLTTIRNFKGNWQVGVKWRLVGGSPYTPWNLETSTKRPAWDVKGRGYLDYEKFNELRLEPFHQLDLRIDKEFYFDKLTLNFYLDIQNLYNYSADSPPYLFRTEDADGNPVVVNPEVPYEEQLYNLKIAKVEEGTILPTIGIIIEF